MPFSDLPIKAGPTGLTVSGLTLSKTAAMTLELAVGSVTKHKDGGVVSLGSSQNHTFTADATSPTQVFMGLITDGFDVDLWVDAYVDDGKTIQGKIPTGYELALEVAWLRIPANETDLDNVSIYRRIWV